MKVVRRRTVLAVGLLLAGLVPACDDGAPRSVGIPPRCALLVTLGHGAPSRWSAYLHQRPTTHYAHTREQRAEGSDLSLDAVAARGVLFAHAFTPSADASAAAAALLTGRHPLETCVDGPGDALPTGATTLAQAFAARGFDTAAFSTTPLAVAGLEAGFETWSVPASPDPADEALLGAALEWIRAREGAPFFAWIHLEAPGDPAPDERAYDARLARTAEAVRGFLEGVRALPGERGRLLDETALVVAGLYGLPPQLAPALSEGQLAIALVLHHPASLTGRRALSSLVGLEQVAPSLAHWFGLDLSREGSLLALADGEAEGPPAVLSLAQPSPHALGLRTPSWRLVHRRSGGGAAVEVWFDLQADPLGERAAPTPPEETALELRRVLQDALARHAGPCVPPHERELGPLERGGP